MSRTHLQVRENLAAAYQIIGKLGLADHTYTHLSARVPGESSYFILPFGLMFEEVTADNLLHVNFDGTILEGSEYQYNKTGYVIHGTIYKARPDLNAIFHLHTHAGIAVSAMKKGLMPISQWALHFYGKLSYHDYNSLALDTDTHSDPLTQDLGSNKTMFLRNHGTLTCGATIHEAMFYTHHLEQACKAQCLALQSDEELILPAHEICEKSVKDLLGFEKDLGKRDWEAYKRYYGISTDRLNSLRPAA